MIFTQEDIDSGLYRTGFTQCKALHASGARCQRLNPHQGNHMFVVYWWGDAADLIENKKKGKDKKKSKKP